MTTTETVVIRVGQSHRFSLQQAFPYPATWMLELLPPGAWVESIEETTVRPPPPAVGGETTRTFTIHGGKEGHGLLRFALANTSGEPTVHARQDFRVQITKAPPIVPLYAVAMQQASASGDLAQMQALAAQAEAHIAQTPEIQTALAALKAEIVKAGS